MSSAERVQACLQRVDKFLVDYDSSPAHLQKRFKKQVNRLKQERRELELNKGTNEDAMRVLPLVDTVNRDIPQLQMMMQYSPHSSSCSLS